MNQSDQPLQIDIVSDIVCPWCIIGYRQLTEALHASNTAHEIHWHPFELNSEMPAEGQNMREHLSEKYGSSAQESEENRRRITAAGAELGFAFNKYPAESPHLLGGGMSALLILLLDDSMIK